MSERLGYRANGDHLKEIDGAARRGVKFALDVSDWERERATNPFHVPVDVDGLDAALPQFGL